MAAPASQHLLPQTCQPVFSFILGLLGGNDLGDPAALRTNIGTIFAQMERQTRQAGITAEEILSARFALTAFIDEAIARSDWSGKSGWAQNPLSLEYFNTNNAGVEFFDRFEELRLRPDAKTDILEVYYTCLALGFEGKYALTDPRQLSALIETTARDLARVRGGSPALSPAWEPPEQAFAQLKNDIPPVVMAAIGFGVVFIIFLILRLLASSSAHQIAAGLKALM
ncbi:MAG: DotU family type IV/VI secretion system protein [candidate division Zixibacteria bacterium]|nr:DotU family type IV/VI secretion system protein [candidate division Zixibacteria bacterium]